MAKDGSIYEILKQDHRVVQDILEKMVKSKSSDGEQRRQLLAKLKEEFIAHAHAEEHLLYQELEHHKASHDLALEAEEEHHAAEQLLHELEQTDVADDHWKAKATVLKELIAHHIEEEESEMFDKAHKVLGDQMEHRMAEQFQQEKQAEQRRI